MKHILLVLPFAIFSAFLVMSEVTYRDAGLTALAPATLATPDEPAVAMSSGETINAPSAQNELKSSRVLVAEERSESRPTDPETSLEEEVEMDDEWFDNPTEFRKRMQALGLAVDPFGQGLESLTIRTKLETALLTDKELQSLHARYDLLDKRHRGAMGVAPDVEEEWQDHDPDHRQKDSDRELDTRYRGLKNALAYEYGGLQITDDSASKSFEETLP
jgi:hypothetical protein